ncbi:MAG: DUF1648 domain-containing protein [Streptosporangiales bacterium]|nr:DUF1648 domain-containing protein [Streptosporangiales bacterium]
MRPRRTAARTGASAGAWAIVVLAGLLVPPLLLRDRLPDPVATHWGPGGRPDDAMGFVTSVAGLAAIWIGICALLFATAAAQRRRTGRLHGWYAAILGFVGGMAVSAQGVTVYANLDRASWEDARHLEPVLVGPVFLAAVGLGALGWWIDRAGFPSAAEQRRLPGVDLRPGERPVWVSRVTNGWLAGGGAAGLAVAAVLAWFTPPSAAVAAAVGAAVVAISTVRVIVDERGLRLGVGLWGWPARLIPLRKIRAAWVEDRPATAYGGWGYRGLPGKATLMVRSGPCLVVEYLGGGQFAVSVDDAERGAGLLNALRERAPTRSR